MSPTHLVFSKATPSDAPAVLSLVRSAYRGETSRAGWTTEADLLADERIDLEGVLEKIEEPQGAVLLARDETGALTASCELVNRDGAVAYFGLFAVDPRRQAGGIGRQVLAEAEGYARRAWGAEKMKMWVIWTREELIAWYFRRGYEKTGETMPFPYEHLYNGKALRDDLYFVVLVKNLLSVGQGKQ